MSTNNSSSPIRDKMINVMFSEDERDFIDLARDRVHIDRRSTYIRSTMIRDAERILGKSLNDHLNGTRKLAA